MDKKRIEILGFIEDLCWLLDSKRNMNFSDVAKIVDDMKKEEQTHKKENVNQLSEDIIGILPRLLVDTTLFGSNRMLNQFADEILGIEIKNWEKRSRNEMIGVIICEIQGSESKKRGVSLYLLENILEKKDEISKLQKKNEAEKNPFRWNDVIHQIVGGVDE
ncbi:MAG: hypothetical protein SOX33_03465 [Agathobacter sp.]|nr:hypothetical protein [Agathobacter sp.]